MVIFTEHCWSDDERHNADHEVCRHNILVWRHWTMSDINVVWYLWAFVMNESDSREFHHEQSASTLPAGLTYHFVICLMCCRWSNELLPVSTIWFRVLFVSCNRIQDWWFHHWLDKKHGGHVWCILTVCSTTC